MPRRILLAIGVYLLFRVPAITRLPVFVDESSYLYWAQLVRQDPGRVADCSRQIRDPLQARWVGPVRERLDRGVRGEVVVLDVVGLAPRTWLWPCGSRTRPA